MTETSIDLTQEPLMRSTGAPDRVGLPSCYETLPLAQSEVHHGTDGQFLRSAFATSFWPIETVRTSGWNGHIPFMFTAFGMLRPRRYVELGTHHGGSLFAACQARRRLGLDTQCVAIDTWQGDAHASFYGAEVLDDLRTALETHGYESAVLEQAEFDTARAKFADASIDLLLIDGLHTYEAVRHDFTTWLPKVAPGGVVMLHDTNVHERDFGVWRLWREIEGQHLSFNFEHGHGLGVLVVDGPDSDLSRLIHVLRDRPEVADFAQHLYETVAERSLGHAQALVYGPHINELTDRVQALNAERDRLAATNEQLRGERDRLAATNEQLRGEADRQVQRHEKLVADFDEVADLMRVRTTERDEVAEDRCQILAQLEASQRESRAFAESKAGRAVHIWWALRNRLRRRR